MFNSRNFCIFAAFLAFQLTPASAASNATPYTFDTREATIDGIHKALFSGLVTCRQLVSSYISRVEALNPTINAILTLNPNALTVADTFDLQIKAGKVTGALNTTLFCIPILLKDNYNTAEMPTTGACLDMAGNQPTIDAAVVAALKNAGAIVLGKTNMHELALEGLSVSSLGGQTFNPYDHTRTAGGSSGGTGAAIAASLAVFGTGTDAVNSLRSPASANSLFSVRPTRGLISRGGIMPISFTQDAIGPFARNMKDLAIALTVMSSVGFDPVDNVTALVPPSSSGVDYSAAISGGSLEGLRFGLVEGFFNRVASNETTPVNDAMNELVQVLQAGGATVVTITDSVYDDVNLANSDVQKEEFQDVMNAYLANPSLTGTRPATFAELYSSGKFLVIPSQYAFINTSLVSSVANSSYALKKLSIQNLTTAVESTFKANKLDALIYPEQKNLVVKIGSASQVGRNGILAALTGAPVVTVPVGFSPASVDASVGIPIGAEILGLPWSESKLLNIASHISDAFNVRRVSSLANVSVAVKSYKTVPIIAPNRASIPSAYPVGILHL